ncbi:MAG: DUF1565 domain-containing protein [Candidatus Cloacimonetes bacterium]|nr:DUF1565 domain-containing protein [Candidatus Cloacimonadota bacterium]
MSKLVFFLVLFVSTVILWGTIINIPADYPSIQEGIYAAVNFDTVLAAPGTYIENIDFEGKAITVGSWYHTTQDTSNISQTIIDGDQNGSVVIIDNVEDSTAVLTGFTITNGNAIQGGGIYCNESTVIFNNLKINANQGHNGGGVYARFSDINLENLTVADNTSEWSGGGIQIDDSSLEAVNLVITGNQAESYGGGVYLGYVSGDNFSNITIADNFSDIYGGGFFCSSCDLVFSNLTIRDNSTPGEGGGIFISDALLCSFSSENRCNIYSNRISGRGRGSDIYSTDFIEVIVDTFTVLEPGDFHASPLEYFSFDILHGACEQVEADLYVSPEGDNGNSGLTPEEPLKTIQYACTIIQADVWNHRTIFLAGGIYSPSTNQECFPVCPPSFVSLIGEDVCTVILDAENTAGVIALDYLEDITLSNMTITHGLSGCGGGINAQWCDPVIENVIITENTAHSGGGIYCMHANPIIASVRVTNNVSTSGTGGGGGMLFCYSIPLLSDAIIENNSALGFAGKGGGIYLDVNAHANMENVVIRNNFATLKGGGLSCWHSDPLMANVTISDNTAGEYGGGMNCEFSGPAFNLENLCNIYCNSTTSNGNGMDLYTNHFLYVNVDTFTVINPSAYYAAPGNDYNFSILHGKLEQVDADLYVSPTGNDENSGLTVEEPMKTIRYASNLIYADIDDLHIIHLLQGVYSPSSNGESFPVELPDYISLIGVGREEVILDAEDSTRVINSIGNDQVLYSNFTVTNGNENHGGGIYCLGSEAVFENLRITGNTANSGGGISCTDSNPVFSNIVIEDNSVSLYGGGISCSSSSIELSDVIIRNNTADRYGGGLNCLNMTLVLEHVTIADNTSQEIGGGIRSYNSELHFNADNRCNIYNNFSHVLCGNDIYSNEDFTVYVDTFTVYYPNERQATPYENFHFSIQHGYHAQVFEDLYVSPEGDNTNSGLDAEHPLKTIIYASTIMLTGWTHHTIYLGAGIYSPSANGEFFPVSLPPNVSLAGVDRDEVILDPEGQSAAIRLIDNNNNATISNLTITNSQGGHGGGIVCESCDPVISNVTIKNSYAAWGGGIYCYWSNAELKNILIQNCSGIYGGAIHLEHSSPFITNLTIADNTASLYAGGIYLQSFSNPILINSILWGNQPQQIVMRDNGYQSFMVIANNDLENGIEAIEILGSGELVNLNGNLNEDPMFCCPMLGNYALSEESPCIDAGTAFFEFDNDVFLDLNENEYYGTAPDMGAFEYGMVEIDEVVIENEKLKIENYPNPFNPETQIVFNLPESEKVYLSVYNLKGQLVRVLADDVLPAGENCLYWDSRNEMGRIVSSGVYLVRLQSGKANVMRKIMLIK